MGAERNLGPIVYGDQRMGWGKGVVAGGFVFLSGVEARLDDEGRPVAGIEAQTELCLRRVDERLAEAGASFADAVKLVWYVRDSTLVGDFFRVRDRWLGERYPALLAERAYASTVVIAELSFADVLAEIDCTAYTG